jgi:hypothetical protein
MPLKILYKIMFSSFLLLTVANTSAESSTITYSTPCPAVIMKKTYNGAPCRTFSIDFANNGKVKKVRVFEIAQSRHRDDDLIHYQNGYYVELSEGKYLDLGSFQPFRSYPNNLSIRSENYIVNSLGIAPGAAGGLCCLGTETFANRTLEEIHGRFCVTYSMIFPFSGSFRDCDGEATPEGTIGYATDVVSWQKARELACERFKRDTKRPCKDSYHSQLSTRIVFKSNKSLHYVTSFRRFLRKDSDHVTTVLKPIKTTSTLIIYDYLVYRINALSGNIELLETTENFPNYNRWTD